jgi:4'-phosphopantetheinyl transferase
VGEWLHLDLIDNEIHIWRIALDSTSVDLEDLNDLLSTDERDRAARFAFPDLRRRFIFRRAARRMILSKYLAIAGQMLLFEKSANGKPRLCNPGGRAEIEFSATHSRDLALVAVSRHAVGVDLEAVQPMKDLDALIARTMNHSEQALLAGLSETEKEQVFFKHWTCKEAVLKATGEGLSQSMSSVAIDLTNSTDRCRLFQNAKNWPVRCLDSSHVFGGAIAAPIADFRVTWFDFSDRDFR